jgi:hypothetical protein
LLIYFKIFDRAIFPSTNINLNWRIILMANINITDLQSIPQIELYDDFSELSEQDLYVFGGYEIAFVNRGDSFGYGIGFSVGGYGIGFGVGFGGVGGGSPSLAVRYVLK